MAPPPLQTAPLFLLFLLFITKIPQTSKGPNLTSTKGNLALTLPKILPLIAPSPLPPLPFQFCFYNITPNAFYLALHIGTARSEFTRHQVWQNNPFCPVRENATFALKPDGNLILTDSDGQTVWSTGTSNIGIVGLEVYAVSSYMTLDTDLSGKVLTTQLKPSQQASHYVSVDPTNLSARIEPIVLLM